MKDKFIKLIEEYGGITLLGSDHSCPCCNGEIFGIKIDIHCWRSGMCCPFSGVHIWRQEDTNVTNKELKEIGKLFADEVAELYHTEVKVVIDKKLGNEK